MQTKQTGMEMCPILPKGSRHQMARNPLKHHGASGAHLTVHRRFCRKLLLQHYRQIHPSHVCFAEAQAVQDGEKVFQYSVVPLGEVDPLWASKVCDIALKVARLFTTINAKIVRNIDVGLKVRTKSPGSAGTTGKQGRLSMSPMMIASYEGF